MASCTGRETDAVITAVVRRRRGLHQMGDVVKYRLDCVLDKAVSNIQFPGVQRKLSYLLMMGTGFTEGKKNYDNSKKPPQL